MFAKYIDYYILVPMLTEKGPVLPLGMINIEQTGEERFKSNFLRVSRIGRQSRKIEFFFISPKHSFR